jgi:hypothetical protein
VNYLRSNENRIATVEAETVHVLVLRVVDCALHVLMVSGGFRHSRTLGEHGIAQCEQQKHGG